MLSMLDGTCVAEVAFVVGRPNAKGGPCGFSTHHGAGHHDLSEIRRYLRPLGLALVLV